LAHCRTVAVVADRCAGVSKINSQHNLFGAFCQSRTIAEPRSDRQQSGCNRALNIVNERWRISIGPVVQARHGMSRKNDCASG
jgi:hypothetical protein